MSGWDGNINSPHTMQDEYELARELGTAALTTDEDGQMVPAPCPRCNGYGTGHECQGQPLERES